MGKMTWEKLVERFTPEQRARLIRVAKECNKSGHWDPFFQKVEQVLQELNKTADQGIRQIRVEAVRR
jgi:hypothetical protein